MSFAGRIVLAVTLAIGGLAAYSAVAAPQPPPAAPPQLAIPEGARATADFDVDRATEAYLGLISPEAGARSDAYAEGSYWFLGLDWLWTLGVAVLFAAGGRASRLRAAIERRLAPGYWADAVTIGILLTASSVLCLPLTLWADFFREHAYHLSNQSLGSFVGDWFKSLGFGLSFSAPAIAVLYVVVRRRPRSWWLLASAVTMLMLLVLTALGPVFIEPAFNEYQSLEPGPLREEILSMARSQRIPADDVLWFDASRRTSRISANVAGFGSTLRIAVNDNLLRRSPRESVLAVVGHEMGHYVLNHTVEMLPEYGLVILAGLAFVHWSFGRAVRRFPSWRLRGIADPAGLLVAIALLQTFLLVAKPVVNTIRRSNEAEADAFGLAIARQPDGFAYVAVQLSEYRKMRPGRLEEGLFYHHPSGYDRIRQAMAWKKEHLAECAEREASPGLSALPAVHGSR